MNVEEQAKQLGWVPQEQFRGPADAWVDAETFVRKGEEILPLVRANNKKLHTELAQTQQQVRELKQLVEAGTDSLKAFEEFHRDSLTRALEQQRIELTKDLKSAREDGDVERELQVQDQLEEVRAAQKEAKIKPVVTPPTKPAEPTPEVDPEFVEWHKENSWFGVDKKKTAFANGLAQSMRADPANNDLTGLAFFNEVAKQVDKAFPSESDERQFDKVGGAADTTPRGGRGRKTFDALPADARAACDRFGERLVGEGRAYKTLADWRNQYAKDYFAGEQQ
jgi:hypothetical protein